MLGKQREDEKRRAKPSTLSVGDTVLMKNLCPTNKLSTNFLKEKFTVIDRQGSNVTVESKDTGKTYDRNTSHVKAVVELAEPIDVEDQIDHADICSTPTSSVRPRTNDDHPIPEVMFRPQN